MNALASDTSRTLDWRETLPTGLRGRVLRDAPLAPFTWFRVGGPADVLFRPADADDLALFLAHLPADVPLTVIGASSNLLIRDGGIRGAVVRLGGGFADIVVRGTELSVGAACLDTTVAEAACAEGIAGLEFLSGVPGSIGGALFMNAGCYGREIKDCLVSARGITRQGQPVTYDLDAMGLSYRHSSVPESVILTGCVLRGTPESTAVIAARMAEMKAKREASQPVRTRTGGSTFANPDGAKAWELIDKAGCRGLTLGGAQVSPLHCNFLLNTGTASASDLESLGELVRQKVLETSGVTLRWEIKRIGAP